MARQTTRRMALASFLAAGILWQAPGATEATKEAQRRKDRRRRRRRRLGSTGLLRPIAVVVDNTRGRFPVTVEHGEWPNRQCCRSFPTVTVPVGTTQRFAASFPEAYLWIDDYYWLNFQNPAGKPPNVSFAFAGMADTAKCCKRVGQTRVTRHSLLVGRPLPVTVSNRTFTVTRTRDNNYKNFTLVLT